MSEPVRRAGTRQDGPATMPTSESGWWERERARFIRERVSTLTRPGAVIADVGCGRGDLLTHGELHDRVIVNVDSYRWASWRHRPGVHHVIASADALPFRDGVFDLVGSFDVLEHLARDEPPLREQVRVVKTDGRVVTAVPADPRLWSGHDEAVGHHRRYDRASFEQLARRSGLAVVRATNFFSFLWAPALLTRRRAVRRLEPGTGTGWAAGAVRRVVGALCAGERWVLRRRDVPLGTSVWFESVPVSRRDT